MDHIAIMKKSWGLTQKVLSGAKTIESRWYKSKYSPWDRIKQGETVYFKDSGMPVTIRAEVDKVLQFSGLTKDKVEELLKVYGADIGINDISDDLDFLKDKKYCILVFLKNPQKIEPFNISKKGFGLMSAWISVEDVSKIRESIYSLPKVHSNLK